MPLHESFPKRGRASLVKMTAVPTPEELMYSLSSAVKAPRRPVFLAWQVNQEVRVLSIVCGLEPGSDDATWVLRSGEEIDAPIIWKYLTKDYLCIHTMLAEEFRANDKPASIPEFLRPKPADQRHVQTSDVPVYEAGEQLQPQNPGEMHEEEETGVGSVFSDRYEIVAEIGKGAMGVVYKARQRVIERFVAIKVLHPHLASKELHKKRFEQEARAASALSHPNVIVIHDFGSTKSGRPFIVMDLVDGATLSDVLQQHKSLALDKFLDIFIQCCSGIGHAHRKGVVHRDMKPSNIRLAQGDRGALVVKILDFGIAKILEREQDSVDKQGLTLTGDVIGSPLYMSPEQCRADAVDSRTDIYSLGCMMYQSITGRLAFLGKDAMDTMYKHVYESARPFAEVRPDLNFPPELERIVFKTLEIEREKRYATMEDLEADLVALQRSGAQVTAKKPAQSHNSIEISSTGLLRQAGIVSQEDLDNVSHLAAEVGGDTGAMLLATGKLEKWTLDAANKCKSLIEKGALEIPRAIILLNYCSRARAGFDEAVRDLGWQVPSAT
ncbi:MAG TPA: serine/threonine-protein kinase [Planktothrix sp.]|jgi:serine/threonine protein kinase